jgi:hypothetical protein
MPRKILSFESFRTSILHLQRLKLELDAASSLPLIFCLGFAG